MGGWKDQWMLMRAFRVRILQFGGSRFFHLPFSARQSPTFVQLSWYFRFFRSTTFWIEKANRLASSPAGSHFYLLFQHWRISDVALVIDQSKSRNFVEYIIKSLKKYMITILTTSPQLSWPTCLSSRTPWRDSHPDLVSDWNLSAVKCPCVLAAGHRLLPAGSYYSPTSCVVRRGFHATCYVRPSLPLQRSLNRNEIYLFPGRLQLIELMYVKYQNHPTNPNQHHFYLLLNNQNLLVLMEWSQGFLIRTDGDGALFGPKKVALTME